MIGEQGMKMAFCWWRMVDSKRLGVESMEGNGDGVTALVRSPPDVASKRSVSVAAKGRV